MTRKKKMIILTIILTLIVGALVYYYPLQRILAEKTYNDYAELQGVSNSDIKSKVFYKDYTQDGYYVSVEYFSDPTHRYKYHYFLIKKEENGTVLNSMDCYVFDMESTQVNDNNDVVYKPIE